MKWPREVQPSAIWWDAPRVMKLSWLTRSPGLVFVDESGRDFHGKGSSGPVDVCVCVFSKLKPWNKEHPTSPCTRVSEPKRILRRLGMWWLTDIDRERDRFDLKCHPFCAGSGFNPLPCKHGRLKIIPLKKTLTFNSHCSKNTNRNMTYGKLKLTVKYCNPYILQPSESWKWRTVGSGALQKFRRVIPNNRNSVLKLLKSHCCW